MRRACLLGWMTFAGASCDLSTDLDAYQLEQDASGPGAGQDGGACTVGASRCNGQVPQTCSARGAWEDGPPCPKVCSAGVCTDTCTPGAMQCNDSVPQKCGPDGQWHDEMACPAGCVMGACTGGSGATLLAHWKFEGNARDELGRFHGEELDGVRYAPGRSGQAVDLTASSPLKSHVRVASDAPDDSTPDTLSPDDVSVSLWLKGTGEQVLEKGRPCMSYYGVWLSGTTLHWDFNTGRDSCDTRIGVTATIDTTVWTHAVGTLERSTDRTKAHLRLYINGAFAAFLTLEGADYSNGGYLDYAGYLVMGRNYMDLDGGTESVNPFSGLLDDVRIYAGVLTADDVAAIYASY